MLEIAGGAAEVERGTTGSGAMLVAEGTLVEGASREVECGLLTTEGATREL